MQHLHFVWSILGLTLSLANPHKAISSSNPTDPVGPGPGTPIGLLLTLTQA